VVCGLIGVKALGLKVQPLAGVVHGSKGSLTKISVRHGTIICSSYLGGW